jgi:uncharacterized membrane protein
MLGLLTGSLFIAAGYWRIKTRVHQGGIFAVLGSSVILLTVFAARELYQMFSPASALFIMFLSVAFVALLSVRHDRQSLALSSLVLASMAPFFTNTPQPDIMVQLTYLLVIVFGSLWVVFLRGWSNLTLGALVVTFLYGLPYLTVQGTDRDIALVFAFVFTAIFFVANILGLIGNENEKNRAPHLLIALGTGMYLILWILGAAPKEWQSLLLVAWTLVFSVGSYVVYRVVERKEAFYIYAGTSLVLLGVATAAELQGAALTIAFTLEIGVLVLLSIYILKDIRVVHLLSWFFVLPILLSLESIISPDWNRGFLHDSFFVLFILMAVLMAIGKAMGSLDRKDSSAAPTLVLFSGMYAVALVWLVLHSGSLFSDTSATFIALVLYTVVGIYFYARGQREGVPRWRYTGGALIALAVGRLLLVEVWNMELSGRIITFLVIGLLLLSTAFMSKQNKSIISENVTPN